jgi:hypothetical protein
MYEKNFIFFFISVTVSLFVDLCLSLISLDTERPDGIRGGHIISSLSTIDISGGHHTEMSTNNYVDGPSTGFSASLAGIEDTTVVITLYF